ncbi:SWI/SNF-related matrix-associated actin-dependent regulator of chromatin subfamily E member 1-related-like isoform X2 [Pocillopora damicornis]|uniref:SWI/SNF-related matrix-associated actin-dependent regulator of chromatin subfamily E member 1-related-like isoform X2 n=1 Tax=Pocillopora damicornis TaxID=46731 RepID=UPI000F5545DC|nr:SWI/SNF-related matrix-associated actin-dependent regulator of chromatin subfamily E member 1-related-like isoform X2 [Pocillopora damicornis]
MENSPVSELSFMPTFSSNQESEGDKTSFETAASSVNCFAEVVVTQNYPDMSRGVTISGNGVATFAVSSSGALTCPGGVLNNQVAVVTVPESQLFAVQQPEQEGSVLAEEASNTAPTGVKKRKGGWPKGKKRKKGFGDLNKPKAPITGYVRFINSRRAEVKQQHPHLQFSEITKILGLEWSNLLQEEKQKYLDEAEEDKKRYIEELKIYQQSEQYQAFIKRQSAKKLKSIVGVDTPEEVPSSLLLSDQVEDDSNELYCKVCNQFFSSLHNKKEHLFGKQHLLMLTGEFEREAEQNANGTEKVPNDSPDLAPCNTVSDTIGTSLISDESMVSISQFTEKFLEQNLNRELELRELRKVVLMSQEENMTLNKDMEELKNLLQKVEDDLGSVKAYGASLTAQLNSLRMVPTLFGVINF